MHFLTHRETRNRKLESICTVINVLGDSSAKIVDDDSVHLKLCPYTERNPTIEEACTQVNFIFLEKKSEDGKRHTFQ